MVTEQLQPTRHPLGAGTFKEPSRRLTVIERRRPGVLSAFRELWRYRRFTLHFGRSILTRRYATAWLGLVWLPLRPVLNIAAKLLVFGGLVGITAGAIPYPVYFLLASGAWVLFAESVLWSIRALEMNRSVLRELHVPRLVVIAGALVPSGIDFLIHIALVSCGLLYYYLRTDHFYLELTLLSPLIVGAALLLLMLLGLGAGLILAAGARARDVRFGLTYLVSFLYFLTPVIYPFELIPNEWKPVALLNPVTGAMELFKLGLIPGEEVSWKALVVTVTAVFALWVPGLWLFQRREVRDW